MEVGCDVESRKTFATVIGSAFKALSAVLTRLTRALRGSMCVQLPTALVQIRGWARIAERYMIEEQR